MWLDKIYLLLIKQINLCKFHENKFLLPILQVHDSNGVRAYIDGSDPKYGNWMAHIQCARSSREQNLKLSQQTTSKGLQLFFIATKDIEYGQELLVWYDCEQVQLYFGLPLALHIKKDASETEQLGKSID